MRVPVPHSELQRLLGVDVTDMVEEKVEVLVELVNSGILEGKSER